MALGGNDSMRKANELGIMEKGEDDDSCSWFIAQMRNASGPMIGSRRLDGWTTFWMKRSGAAERRWARRSSGNVYFRSIETDASTRCKGQVSADIEIIHERKMSSPER